MCAQPCHLCCPVPILSAGLVSEQELLRALLSREGSVQNTNESCAAPSPSHSPLSVGISRHQSLANLLLAFHDLQSRFNSVFSASKSPVLSPG